MRLVVALILMLAPIPALAAKSLALIIGNDSYVEVPALQKARADAQGYAAHFQALGYEVTLVLDAGGRAMDEALASFYDRIAPGDTVVFVFSGHGWSDGRQNFLLPVDIRAQGSETLLARESVALRNGVNGVVDEIALRGPGLTVAIIDACRNNPFQPPPGTRSVGLARGLAPEAAPTGTFLAFSAGAGQTALDRLGDDDGVPYSVFTRHFLAELAKPQDLQSAFKATQAEVNRLAATVGHPQRPAYYDEVVGLACLSGSCERAPEGTAPAPQQAAPQQTAAVALPQPFRLGSAPAPAPAAQPAPQPALQPAPQAATQPVPTPVPQPVPQPQAPAPDPAALAAATQAELTRIGCHPGPADGRDTNATRAALARFAAGSGRTVALPAYGTAEMLDLARAETRAVCSAALLHAFLPEMLTGTWDFTVICGPGTAAPGLTVTGRATLQHAGAGSFQGQVANSQGEQGRLEVQSIDNDLHVTTTWADGATTVMSLWPHASEMRMDGIEENGCLVAMLPAAF
jgi:hypothetical protein